MSDNTAVAVVAEVALTVATALVLSYVVRKSTSLSVKAWKSHKLSKVKP